MDDGLFVPGMRQRDGAGEMVSRHGVPFAQYPWRKHAEDAILGTKSWLKEIGAWSYYEQSVAQASMMNTCIAC